MAAKRLSMAAGKFSDDYFSASPVLRQHDGEPSRIGKRAMVCSALLTVHSPLPPERVRDMVSANRKQRKPS